METGAESNQVEIQDDRESRELSSLIDKRYDLAAKSQSRVFSEMEQCRLFYRGDQWLRPVSANWVPIPEHKWRVRLVINKLPVLIDLFISTHLKNKPIIFATPASNEQSDRISAQLSEDILRYYWNEHNYDTKLVEILRYVGVMGSCFVRFSWDNNAGSVISGSPAGDVVMDVLSPYTMSIEPGATFFEQAKWCVVTEYLCVSELEKRFNTKIEPERPNASSQSLQPIVLNRDLPQNADDRCPLFQMYERPSEKYPQGRLVYRANGKILGVEDLPRGDIRIVHFRGLDLPGEFWPSSVVSQIIPLQMELNKGRSQLVELRNLQSRPPILFARGSISGDEPVYIPGRKVAVDTRIAGGLIPQPMAPTQVPPWVLNLLQMAESDMMDLSSKHEMSQGIQSSNVRSASQANIMQQADESRLAPQIRCFQESLKLCGKYTLRFVQENKEGDQVLSIVGSNMQAEVIEYNQQDLTDNCNVNYEIASQLQWSKESMRQNALYMKSIGLLDDDAFWSIYPHPTVQKLYQKDSEHVQNARLENARLEQAYFEPFPSDKHEVHIKEHEAYVNRPELRDRYIQELMEESKKHEMISQQQGGEMSESGAVIGTEMPAPGSSSAVPGMGAEQPPQEEGPVPPPSAKNHYRHIESHKKQLGGPQKEPPKVRVDVSSTDIAGTPEGQKLISDIIQSSTDMEQRSEPGKENAEGVPTPGNQQQQQQNPSPPATSAKVGM